mgnify:CR=1 FL=1
MKQRNPVRGKHIMPKGDSNFFVHARPLTLLIPKNPPLRAGLLSSLKSLHLEETVRNVMCPGGASDGSPAISSLGTQRGRLHEVPEGRLKIARQFIAGPSSCKRMSYFHANSQLHSQKTLLSDSCPCGSDSSGIYHLPCHPGGSGADDGRTESQPRSC